ncbi:uncharacterized protein METZ01_LOCUS461973, partial [marine metagenome]
ILAQINPRSSSSSALGMAIPTTKSLVTLRLSGRRSLVRNRARKLCLKSITKPSATESNPSNSTLSPGQVLLQMRMTKPRCNPPSPPS